MQVFCFFKGLFGPLVVKYKIKGRHQLMALLVESPGNIWYHITRDKEWCVCLFIHLCLVCQSSDFPPQQDIVIRIMLITLFKPNHFSDSPASASHVMGLKACAACATMLSLGALFRVQCTGIKCVTQEVLVDTLYSLRLTTVVSRLKNI